MKQALAILAAAAAAACCVAAGAAADVTPVGPLPKGPTATVTLKPGTTFRVTLPKPAVRGGVWRVARAYDRDVVRETDEGDTAAGGVWVRFRAVGAGTTRVVFALTRGETSHSYDARTFRFVVAGSGCPTGLLPHTANPIGPAVTAALVADDPANDPQVTGALLATSDPARGGAVKAECGKTVWQRTVVVYITDRAFLPAQSAAQRVVYVGRTRAGYRVWQRAR